MDRRDGGMEMDWMDRGTDGWRDGGMDRMDERALGLRDGLADGLGGWTKKWTRLTDRETEGWTGRGWTDGLDKWMVKKIDWTYGRTEEKRRMDESMNGRTEGWTGGTNGRTGSTDGLKRQMVGRTGWMDWKERLNGRTDRQVD